MLRTFSRFARSGTAVPAVSRTIVAAQRGMSAEASFDFEPCLTHKLDEYELPTTGTLNKDDAIDYLKQMMVVRRMETVSGELYRAKKIRGFCHLYSGQEAVATGMCAALDKNDAVISAYRIHGWGYLLGLKVSEVVGELLGTRAGCSAGKGGSMHMYGENFYGGNGIVGAQVPLGAGLALANQYLDNKTVSVSLYGDGASNQGQVFEAYNIAKLWNLPSIFVCENNKYGMGTSAERSSANHKYYTRGDYIPGIWVDGMDIVAVKEATAWAREYALEKGPIVMEMETYRYHGHSMSDPDTTYRTRDQIAETRKLYDPILQLKAKIVESGWAEEAELKAMEKAIRKEVAAEVAIAETAGEPAFEMLTSHILTGEKMTDIRGCDITISYDSP